MGLSLRPSQIHPIHVQPQGLFADLCLIAMRFLLRRVFAPTKHATIPLTPCACLSRFILALRIQTLWTLLHLSILAHLPHHSEKTTVINQLQRRLALPLLPAEAGRLSRIRQTSGSLQATHRDTRIVHSQDESARWQSPRIEHRQQSRYCR
jgi:hypothetical protein